MPAVKALDHSAAEALCSSFGIEILPYNVRFRTGSDAPPQICGSARLQRLIERHGEDVVWKALYALLNTTYDSKQLQSAVVSALIDLLLQYPSWGKRLGEFCDALDKIKIGELYDMCRNAPGIDGGAPKRRVIFAAYLEVLLLPEMEARSLLYAPEDLQEAA